MHGHYQIQKLKKQCVFFVVPGNSQASLGMPDTAALNIINLNIDSIHEIRNCKTNRGQETHAVTEDCTKRDTHGAIVTEFSLVLYIYILIYLTFLITGCVLQHSYELFYALDYTKMYMDTDFQTSGLLIRESQRSYSVKEYYWIYLLYSLSAGIVLRNIYTLDFNSIYTGEPYI